MIKTLLPGVGLLDVLCRVIDGADDLACRGYGPDFEDYDEIPAELVAEMASLAAECKLCRIGPGPLADHWMSWKLAQLRDKYERALPVWACDCGLRFKLEAAKDEDRLYQLLTPGRDSLLGVLAGTVRRSSKGKVTRADPCPGCGVSFAETRARQADPQGSLF